MTETTTNKFIFTLICNSTAYDFLFTEWEGYVKGGYQAYKFQAYGMYHFNPIAPTLPTIENSNRIYKIPFRLDFVDEFIKYNYHQAIENIDKELNNMSDTFVCIECSKELDHYEYFLDTCGECGEDYCGDCDFHERDCEENE